MWANLRSKAASQLAVLGTYGIGEQIFALCTRREHAGEGKSSHEVGSHGNVARGEETDSSSDDLDAAGPCDRAVREGFGRQSADAAGQLPLCGIAQHVSERPRERLGVRVGEIDAAR